MKFYLRTMALCVLLGSSSASAQVSVKWTDINPDQSNFAASEADGASGGRVNHIALSSDSSVALATTEWGGIYRSTDLGLTWSHLDGHVPTVTWDVGHRSPELQPFACHFLLRRADQKYSRH